MPVHHAADDRHQSGSQSTRRAIFARQRSAHDVICFSQSWAASNANYGYRSVRKSAGSSVQAQALHFGSLGATSDAFYHLSCQVPGTYSGNASGIVSYLVEES